MLLRRSGWTRVEPTESALAGLAARRRPVRIVSISRNNNNEHTEAHGNLTRVETAPDGTLWLTVDQPDQQHRIGIRNDKHNNRRVEAHT